MTDKPAFRKLLAATATLGVIAAVAAWAMTRNTGGDAGPLSPAARAAEEKKEAAARSWPMFGGTIQRNLVNLVEKDLPRDWKGEPKGTNVKWVVDLGSKAYGGPTVGGGKIFMGTNNNRPRDKEIRGDKGVLMCFDEATGEFLWQLVHDKLEAGRVNDWPEEGICSAPAIEGDRIYYLSNRCEVVCATTEGLKEGTNVGVTDEKYKGKGNGDVVWRHDLIGEDGVFPHNLATCSPIIVGDTLFVITANGVDEGHINIPAPGAPSFMALDKKTGKTLWKSNLPGKKIMHGQWSNPVYAVAEEGKPQVIFPGGDGFVYSFDPKSGELLWKFDCNPRGAEYKLGGTGTRNDFVCTPVVAGKRLYIGVGQDPEHKKGVGHLWCIDITKKPTNKEKDVSPYSPDDKKVPAPQFDPKDAKNKDSALVWHFGGAKPKDAPADPDDDRPYFFGRTMSTCAVHDGLCYAADFDGFFYCFDAETGKLHYKQDLDGADTWSSPYWVDGHVYVGNESGQMHIFAHGKTKKLVKAVAMKGKIRTTPVAVNGVLYVGTENPCKLWALKK